MAVRALLFDLWGTLLYVDDPETLTDRRREAYVGSIASALRTLGLVD